MIIKGKLENFTNTVSFRVFAVLRWPVTLDIDSSWLRRASADQALRTCWACRQNRLFCVLLYSTFFNSLSHPHSLLWLLFKVYYGSAVQLPFLQRSLVGSSVRTETLSCLFSHSWNLWPVYSSSEKWHVQPKKRHFAVSYLSYSWDRLRLIDHDLGQAWTRGRPEGANPIQVEWLPDEGLPVLLWQISHNNVQRWTLEKW